MLMPEGKVAFAERLRYYAGQDTWIRFALTQYFIEPLVLEGLDSCFHGGTHVYVNERGVERIKRDHPDLADEFEL
jgi:hypothetical protein